METLSNLIRMQAKKIGFANQKSTTICSKRGVQVGLVLTLFDRLSNLFPISSPAPDTANSPSKKKRIPLLGSVRESHSVNSQWGQLGMNGFLNSSMKTNNDPLSTKSVIPTIRDFDVKKDALYLLRSSNIFRCWKPAECTLRNLHRNHQPRPNNQEGTTINPTLPKCW